MRQHLRSNGSVGAGSVLTFFPLKHPTRKKRRTDPGAVTAKMGAEGAGSVLTFFAQDRRGVSPHFFRQHKPEKSAGLTPTPGESL